MKSLIVILLVMMGFVRAEASLACDVCVQVDKMAKAYEEDEKKAYDNFNKLISQVQLSKDKAVRKQELTVIVKTAVLMENSDDRQELAPYLADMQKEYPQEFKEALGALPKEARKSLEDQIKIANRLMEKGEEP
ncbi:hypothetical protein [Bdellovibrio sp. BCCA]|uniref:hypothetical protein n=1 Tax=Bdellovibrio sp. BCCA TaxID=3136281 RepID=UPI0030F1378F